MIPTSALRTLLYPKSKESTYTDTQVKNVPWYPLVKEHSIERIS